MKKRLDKLPANIDGETLRQILKASEELFLARGYKGVSMKDIADVVQITPAALYYYFPKGKEDLFVSVIRSLFEEWVTGMDQVIAGARDIRERLQLLVAYHQTLPIHHFAMLMRDAREQIKNMDKRKVIFDQLRLAFEGRIRSIFQQAIDAGEIRADIPSNILARMYMGMNMALLPSTEESEEMNASSIASMLVSALLDGIASSVQKNHS